MNIVPTPGNVFELLEAIGCKGADQQQRGDWLRVFIHLPNDETDIPLSLGRVMFEHGQYKWVKWYSEPGTGDIQEFDRVWFAWYAYTIAGKTISDQAWLLMKHNAQAEAVQAFKHRKAERKTLNDTRILQGKKPRGGRVAPPNPRGALRKVVGEWLSEVTGREVVFFAF